MGSVKLLRQKKLIDDFEDGDVMIPTDNKKVNLHISLFMDHLTDIRKCMINIRLEQKYDSAVFSIKHPAIHRQIHADPTGNCDCDYGFRSETLLRPNSWLNIVVGKLSENLDLDSDDPHIKARDTREFEQETQYIRHIMQYGHCLLKLKLYAPNINLGLNAAKSGCTIVVEVPMNARRFSHYRSDKEETQPMDCWAEWKQFHAKTAFATHVYVGLVLTETLPSELELRRWMSEPLKYIIIGTDLLDKDRKRAPPPAEGAVTFRTVIRDLLKVTQNFILKIFPNESEKFNYGKYLDELCQEVYVTDRFMRYANVLELPLQPLYDDLDSYTYELFESDPIKYSLYQKAIMLALEDKVPVEKREEKTIVVMILGAGRGPLVRAVINASKLVGVKVKIIIVEKNMNANVALRANIRECWQGFDITLFNRDMRDFHPEEKADIIISELLGSFGDNELAPECLNGALQHLKDDGISIPNGCTSFVSPIMSTKLHDCCRSIHETSQMANLGEYEATVCYETVFVVYPRNAFHIARAQEVFHFEFTKANHDLLKDNSRRACVTFKSEADALLHGFIGYFEASLYKDIIISINPETHTPGMSSWFPVYFPLTDSQYTAVGCDIEVNFGRCIKPHQVYYEWSVAKPTVTRIHNEHGTACGIKLI